MTRRPPRSTLSSSSAASDVYKRQTRKYLLDIEVDRILEFESGLFEYISTKYPDIFEKIREEKKLSDELEDALKKAITEFKETF